MKNFNSIHMQLKKQLAPVGSNVSNSDSSSNNAVSPMKNFSSIQMELKKQLANNDSRNRGPPPPAPNRNVSNSFCCKIVRFAVEFCKSLLFNNIFFGNFFVEKRLPIFLQKNIISKFLLIVGFIKEFS